MTTDKYLGHRGRIWDLQGHGPTVYFVTVHPEGQPTALYALDGEKLELAETPLPAGGTALAIDAGGQGGPTVWVGGSDRRLYRCDEGKKPKPLGGEFTEEIVAVAPLPKDRLAVVAGAALFILNTKDDVLSTLFELPDDGSALAVDPTGEWIVVGTEGGTLLVFESEGRGEFIQSESAKLHDAAVTALLFEPEELRFYSAGADNKLLLTHARGTLEPEDRGRGNNHTDRLTDLVLAGEDRFLSGGRDGVLKSWLRGGGTKPATVKDGVVAVTGMARITVHNRQRVVASGHDNTLRLFPLDAAGKIGELSARIHDAYDRAAHEFSGGDAARREKTLGELAGYGDLRSLELIHKQATADRDAALRKLATELLGASGSVRVVEWLEKLLRHDDEAVRRAALSGLRALLGESELRPLDLALKVKKADIGVEAVRALEALAKQDDQALSRLVTALNFDPLEVRQSALAALENVQPKNSPEADLSALRSKHVDTRRVALIRLHQRGLLEQPRVRAALRRASEDEHAEVRQTAVLVSILTSEPLATALRARDPELHRHLAEIESFTFLTFAPTDGKAAGKPKNAKETKEAKPPKQPDATKEQLELTDADLEPLLEAMASRAVDTSLAGAMCLALLGDARALGLLLQLSREPDAAARVVVCRALASLDDRRAEDRLRTLLDDKAAEVRDAAFSALEALYQSDPIEAAKAGLSASEKDVRGRGLKVLLKLLRGKPTKDARAQIEAWLLRALNDRDVAVRTEAYKACLNARVGGDEAGTLRFVLQSIHADIRREVLTEVMAEHKRPWAQALLFELFDDPDPTLRKEAFAFAAKKADKKDYEPYERALASRFPGVRSEAVAALVRRGTKAAQKLLAGAIEDKAIDVRQRALEALVDADARDVLTRAMGSEHIDIRLRAARARARMGDGDALGVLRELATQDEPQDKGKDHQEAWRAVTAEALIGLGELGDPEAAAVAVQRLDSPHAEIRQAAATALIGMARPQTVPALKLVLQHDDEQVRHRIALALAFAGDPTGESIVHSKRAMSTLSGAERLAASVTLPESDERLAAFLDDDDAALRRSALLVLMLRDDRTHDGAPRHLLACLAARHPRVRLIAADALEAFPDSEAYREFLTRTVNDRGDEAAWTVPRQTVETLSQILAVAEPPLVARAVLLLPLLAEEKQRRWDLAWSAFAERYADDLGQIAKDAGKLKTPPVTATPDELRELALGTYVGLVREAGGSYAENVRVRQTAIRRLVELAERDGRFRSAAQPVLTQSLGDPAQAVRFQAFDALRALGRDPQRLGTEALETGHEDLGERGLQLLTEGMSDAAGRKALEEVVTTRTDELALVAAKLLRERHDPMAVAQSALEAVSENVRLMAVRWLAADINPPAGSDIDPKRSQKAQKALEAALGSRYRTVRLMAAIELARKKDAAAFDVLVELLGSSRESAEQPRLIAAIEELGDERGPDALLDCLERDIGGPARAMEFVRAAGRFRQPASVERMLSMMNEERFKPQRRNLFEAVLTISGYDQPDEDRTALSTEDALLAAVFGSRPEREPLAGATPESKQHPRHPDVLAKLMRTCLDLGELRWLRELIEPARRSQGGDVDPVFAQLIVHTDDELRREAVNAYGWRVRRRDASVEPLRKALEQKDPQTKFLAAEALARAGHADGINVLMTAVDLMSDIGDRQRAVAALGELADERALDVLLKIAAEEAHALQEPAVEALGHMGRSDKADDIFKLLARLARDEGGLAQRAIRGLRWFDTPGGWQLVRERASDERFFIAKTAVEMLGFNDDPATRALLLELIADDTYEHTEEALHSARRLFGPDSLEPDYALLSRGDADMDLEDHRRIVARVCKRGEPARILELIPRCEFEPVQRALATALLRREDIPVEAAASQLDSRNEAAVETAAHLLGRSGQVTKQQAAALTESLRRWWARWQEERAKPQPRWGEHPVEECTPVLTRLVWAAGRLGSATDELIALAAERAGDVHFAPVRLAAIRALAGMPPTDAVLDALAAAAVGPDPEIRHAAAQALAEFKPQRAAALAGQLLSDRASLARLTRAEGIDSKDLKATLETAAAQVHYQGVALPELIAAGDLSGLQAVAQNRELPETTRLGAVEAIGRLASEPAETALAAIGANDSEDEPIRKEAWRARRRSIRLRSKAVV